MREKKIFLYILLGIFAFIICPNVKAEINGYITLDGVKNNDVAAEIYDEEDDIVVYYLANSAKFDYTLTGHGVDSEVWFRIDENCSGGYGQNNVSGEMLNDGYTFIYEDQPNSYNMYFPFVTFSLKEDNGDVIPIKVGDDTYNGFKLYFVDPDIFVAWEERFHEMAPNGEIALDTIKPSDQNYADSMITTAVAKYNDDELTFYGYCDYEDPDKCYITFTSNDNMDIYKVFAVKYTYAEENKTVASKVATYAEAFKEYAEASEGPVSLFRLEDLENINYLYTFVKHPTSSMDEVNAVVHFSGEINKMLGYSNIGLAFDMRMGDDLSIASEAYGYMTLSYDGIVYGVVENVGYQRVNVIYVPDDTEETRDAYIAAAKARIEAYLKGAEVSIAYKAGTTALEDYERAFFNEDKTLGEYYTLTLDGEEFYIVIEKDSSKIQNPEMNTVDLITDIKVNTDSSEVPLDSKVEASILDKNSDEYKNLMKKLNISDGISVDLKLFSDTAEVYISKLNDGKFRVYIPISAEYKDKNLKAYYLNEDGTIEEFGIVISEDGKYAVFETTHFSTYTIADTTENPPTNDNIMTYVFTGLISLLVLGALVVGSKKIRNK